MKHSRVDIFYRRFLCRLRRSSYGIIGDFPTDNAGQTTLQKAGRSGCGFATGASFVGKAADRFPNCPGGEGDTLECHHRLTQHRTAGVPHIDADTCHEAVNFLRNLEKADCA